MFPRVLAIPAALVVLVGAPPLIVRGLNPSPSEPPPPPTASLKVHVTGDSGGKGHPIFVRLRAKKPAPTAASRLFAEDGLHAATVRPAAAAACAKQPIRQTGTGIAEWCLKVTGVDAGHDLTGTVKKGTTLALTVTRKNSFWGLPLLFLILGFIGAAIVALFPKALRRYTQSVALDRAVARGADIAWLDSWVAGQRASGKTDAALLTIVEPIVVNGPARVRAARTSLAHAVATTTLPVDLAYVAAAGTEAERKDFTIDDFVDDGKARDALLPVEWERGLVPMQGDANRLAELEAWINDNLNPDCRKAPLAKLADARATFETIEQPTDVKDMDAAIAAVAKEYRLAYDRDGCRQASRHDGLEHFGGSSEMLTAAVEDLRDVISVARASERAEAAPSANGRTALVWTAMILTGLAIAVFAAMTVYEAAYAPKPAFADFSDYFALFSAALASTAAGAVIGMLAYWHPAEAA